MADRDDKTRLDATQVDDDATRLEVRTPAKAVDHAPPTMLEVDPSRLRSKPSAPASDPDEPTDPPSSVGSATEPVLAVTHAESPTLVGMRTRAASAAPPPPLGVADASSEPTRIEPEPAPPAPRPVEPLFREERSSRVAAFAVAGALVLLALAALLLHFAR